MKHIKFFQMDGAEISTIERTQPLYSHNTPNATHTLKCEEPRKTALDSLSILKYD